MTTESFYCTVDCFPVDVYGLIAYTRKISKHIEYALCYTSSLLSDIHHNCYVHSRTTIIEHSHWIDIPCKLKIYSTVEVEHSSHVSQ